MIVTIVALVAMIKRKREYFILSAIAVFCLYLDIFQAYLPYIDNLLCNVLLCVEAIAKVAIVFIIFKKVLKWSGSE